MSAPPNQRAHRPLFQHHWGLHAKPAQRQMGNFLRGKGGLKKKKKNILERSKSSRMCVFPLLFFRVKNAELGTLGRVGQTELKRRENTHLLYGVLIKRLVLVPSFPHQRLKLCRS